MTHEETLAEARRLHQDAEALLAKVMDLRERQSSPPIVRAAIAALDLFGALDREHATALLALWARNRELTRPEAEQVIAHYPAGHLAPRR